MTTLRYAIYDVFTRERLSGNPLAVVMDADGLDTETMQRIAGEFNLSETSFVLKPKNQIHQARVRIFTPHYEMPFAGHPTVGTAIALCEAEDGDEDSRILVLEENIGPVRCAVSVVDGVTFAEFDLPQLPERQALSTSADMVGAALGLGPHEIGFENHKVACWSAGVPYVTVPVANLEAAARAKLNVDAWGQIAPQKSDVAYASAYVYTRETVHHDSAFHSRMFVHGSPSYEDPATGSAAAAFSGAVLEFDEPVDGKLEIWIEQGIEMGRASRLRLEIEIDQQAIKSARIGGHAVKVAQGELLV